MMQVFATNKFCGGRLMCDYVITFLYIRHLVVFNRYFVLVVLFVNKKNLIYNILCEIRRHFFIKLSLEITYDFFCNIPPPLQKS